MLVVSFYTVDYRNHAPRFRRECEALGLRHRVEELPCTGSYLRNCQMKPRYILSCLRDERGPVLWVDVDGSILSNPTFFSDSDPYDFQAKRMRPPRKRTWHVGTMWWNFKPAALAFLERWIANCGPSEDESALEKTWREIPDIRARDIPDAYFRIGDERDAVILHRLSHHPAKRRESRIALRYEQEVM